MKGAHCSYTAPQLGSCVTPLASTPFTAVLSKALCFSRFTAGSPRSVHTPGPAESHQQQPSAPTESLPSPLWRLRGFRHSAFSLDIWYLCMYHQEGWVCPKNRVSLLFQSQRGKGGGQHTISEDPRPLVSSFLLHDKAPKPRGAGTQQTKCLI